MIDFEDFYQRCTQSGLSSFVPDFRHALEQRFADRPHGELDGWLNALSALPKQETDSVSFGDTVIIGSSDQCDTALERQLHQCLELFHPWRKGPFNLFGIEIDTEWRSNLKWQRVSQHIQPLKGRRILDVGCGNAYYCWRMLEQEPNWVVGIDPSIKFMMQFLLMKHFVHSAPIDYLPLRSEDLPAPLRAFDTVFSMGVLYHRRSPFDHLEELKQALAPGGELVLETLVVQGGPNEVLVPADRYAQMRNVWFIPSPSALENWLRRIGFESVRTVDLCPTDTSEQRATRWMRFHSLEDYLDPDDPTRTVEGYPAPLRATLIAKAPQR